MNIFGKTPELTIQQKAELKKKKEIEAMMVTPYQIDESSEEEKQN